MGVIFSFDPSTSTYIKLHDFNVIDGSLPYGSLLQASDGRLYGMTSAGGSGDLGVIFSFDPSTSTYTALKHFDNTIGANPFGSLMQASDGKLYGVTTYGGSLLVGVIFSFDIATGHYTKLHDFDYSNLFPRASLTQASDGKLYGTANSSNVGYGYGVIFSFEPSSSKYKVVHYFNGGNGWGPMGNLLQASDRKLYGMTTIGGSENDGVIFSFDPAAAAFKKLQDYTGSNGSYGYYGSGFIEIKQPVTSPTVNLTAPANNATYLAPAAHIKLNAIAADSNGTNTKVEFYKDSTLLHTETVIPYGYNWKNVPLGNYTITAKAYDNSGNVTTSSPVHISVVPNKPPVVNMIAPVNNQSFTAPATIHFEAAASDTDGRITNVKFYNGTILLNIQYKAPYTYNWTTVPAGTYTITAVATDDWGAQTTSAPVTIIVSNSVIASNKPYLENKKTTLNNALSLRLSPNPASNILNIYTSGLQQNKPATLSIISVSGIVLKNVQISKSVTQLDVSSLASGEYTLKIVSRDKIFYKQFVKL